MTRFTSTFGDRDEPSMGESVQLTESQAEPGNGAVTALCMECAIRRHDYREMLRHETGDDDSSETPFPQARIDGRRHMLLPRAWSDQETCTECNRKAPGFYVRMK